MTLRSKLTIAFLVAVVVRLAFQLWTGFVADDSFITFRYAQNLASGAGFVYNPGEQVLGTSTPLFAWILAVLVTCKVPVIMAALVISLLSSGLTAAILYRLAGKLRFGRLVWLPVLVYALWPRSVPAEISGMETALFTLLITAAFYYRYCRQDYYAIGLATLATLTRPEGGLLLVIIFADCLYRERHRLISYLLTPAALIVPWLLFAYVYFGSILPHSIPAKLALYSQFGAASWWQNLIYLMAWHNPVGWITTMLAIAGGYWLYQKQNFGKIEMIWLVVMIGVYTFGRTHLFFWYVTPIYPILILFASAAAVWALDRFRALRVRPTALSVATAAGITMVPAVGLWRQADHYQKEQAYAESVLRETGYYLLQKVDAQTEIVAAEDIGYIGFYSRCRILDRDGLVSRDAVEYNSQANYLQLILDHRPNWVGARVGSPISGFLDDLSFLVHYSLDSTFGDSIDASYQVYRRIK